MENVKDYVIEQCEFGKELRTRELPIKVTYHLEDEVVLLDLEESLVLPSREAAPQIVTYLRHSTGGGYDIVVVPVKGRGRIRFAHFDKIRGIDEMLDLEEKVVEDFNPNDD